MIVTPLGLLSVCSSLEIALWFRHEVIGTKIYVTFHIGGIGRV